MFVQGRRDDADTGDAGKDEEEDATDSGLGGVADVLVKALAAFVESVVLHVLQDVGDMVRGGDTATRGRMGPVVGQDGGHGGDVAAGDEGGTLACVDVDGGFDGGVEASVGVKKVGKGMIPVAVLVLALVDGGRQAEPPVGKSGQGVVDTFLKPTAVGNVGETGGGHGAPVVKGVESVLRRTFDGDHGVKHVVGHCVTNAALHRGDAMVLQGKGESKNLADGLDGDFVVCIAPVKGLSVDRDNGDGVQVGVDMLEGGNVGGVFSRRCSASTTLVGGFQECFPIDWVVRLRLTHCIVRIKK